LWLRTYVVSKRPGVRIDFHVHLGAFVRWRFREVKVVGVSLVIVGGADVGRGEVDHWLFLEAGGGGAYGGSRRVDEILS
jgi:hypothetical protein